MQDPYSTLWLDEAPLKLTNENLTAEWFTCVFFSITKGRCTTEPIKCGHSVDIILICSFVFNHNLNG